MRQTTELGQLRASTISSRQLILSLQKKIHLWGEEVEDERWEKSFLVQWTLLIFLKTIAKGTTDQPAVASFDSCYRLLTALTAVTSCRQFWHLLQTVASFDIFFYKLSPALTADTSCRQLWWLIQAVGSFDICYKLPAALTSVTSCCPLLQGVDSCYKLLIALTAVTS